MQQSNKEETGGLVKNRRGKGRVTCQKMSAMKLWIIFLVDTISFGLAKNSNLQYVLVEYCQKLVIYFIVGVLT
jgi:hypothetical protein